MNCCRSMSLRRYPHSPKKSDMCRTRRSSFNHRNDTERAAHWGWRRITLLLSLMDPLAQEKVFRAYMFSAADIPKHFRLVLAGLQDAEAAKIINSFMSEMGERRSLVIILNRFCSELEEGWVFAAADVMWLCYENF